MHRFDSEAMNTNIDVLICGVEYNYARSAAIDAFADLAMMESLMSMYREGSDISMVNSSAPGDVVKLTGTVGDCIFAAFQANEMSRGAIDICMGEFFLKAKNDKNMPKSHEPRRGKFAFDYDNFLIQKLEDGAIDLGAIGKGFATDELAKKLAEFWGIENAFISFGGSSVLAFGKPDDAGEWTVNITGSELKVPMAGRACGASGTAVQGCHIIDCRTGKVPENQPYRTWAFTQSGAIADAMSTAFMILSRDEAEEVCNEYGISAILQQTPESEMELINFRDGTLPA